MGHVNTFIVVTDDGDVAIVDNNPAHTVWYMNRVAQPVEKHLFMTSFVKAFGFKIDGGWVVIEDYSPPGSKMKFRAHVASAKSIF
jgi:succinate dehydrogenase hydrophobic anchor subunit